MAPTPKAEDYESNAKFAINKAGLEGNSWPALFISSPNTTHSGSNLPLINNNHLGLRANVLVTSLKTDINNLYRSSNGSVLQFFR
jgi:hypothetical protein